MTTELANLLNQPVTAPALTFDRYSQLRAFERPGLDALNFEVETRQLHTTDGTTLRNHFAVGKVGRPDVIYDVCGKVWKPIQPQWVGNLASMVAELTGGTIERSYALKDGLRFGVIVALPGHLTLNGGETNFKCIRIGCGQDGTAMVGCSYMYRPICKNRYYALIDTGSKKHAKVTLRIRHTKNGAIRVQLAEEIVEKLSSAFVSTEEIMYRLSKRVINPKNGDLAAYYDKVIPYPVAPATFKDSKEKETFEQTMERLRAIRKAMCTTFMIECDQLKSEPTAWLALNSATKWAQHDMRIKGKDNPENREWSAAEADGTGFKLSILAQEAARAMWPH